MEIALDWLTIATVIAFGLVIGSFLNVCIARMPENKDIVFRRSHCPHCKTNIAWYHNIPLLSFILLRGHCHSCKGKISWRYPLVEAIMPLLLFVMLWKYPFPIAWPFHIYFMGALVVATFIDLQHWIIPDKLTLPGIPLGLVASLLIPGQSWVDHTLGMLIGGGSLFLIGELYIRWKQIEGIGGGDIKFLAMGGAFLGVKGAIVTLIVSSIGGSIIGAIVMIGSGKGGKTAIPFGPFLALGMLVSYTYGDQLWRWYLDLAHPAHGMIR